MKIILTTLLTCLFVISTSALQWGDFSYEINSLDTNTVAITGYTGTGGEIFIPKIPSIRILDLVEAMCGSKDHELIGIRPGEKLHEIMVPEEMAHHCVEFDDHFVITPAIRFSGLDINYVQNKLFEIFQEYKVSTGHHQPVSSYNRPAFAQPTWLPLL